MAEPPLEVEAQSLKQEEIEPKSAQVSQKSHEVNGQESLEAAKEDDDLKLADQLKTETLIVNQQMMSSERNSEQEVQEEL